MAPQIQQSNDARHHFPVNIWPDSWIELKASGAVRGQLKTKGNPAERSPPKDWNEMEEPMADRNPSSSRRLELWLLYGCCGTLCWSVPKGHQGRLLWRHNFLTKGCCSIMYAYIVWTSKIHGRISKFCELKWKCMTRNITCCGTLLANLAICRYKRRKTHQRASIFDELRWADKTDCIKSCSGVSGYLWHHLSGSEAPLEISPQPQTETPVQCLWMIASVVVLLSVRVSGEWVAGGRCKGGVGRGATMVGNVVVDVEPERCDVNVEVAVKMILELSKINDSSQ